LPDRFGNALINAWLATEGRDEASFGPLDRLAYTGTRAMGALEYLPAVGPDASSSDRVDVEAMRRLAGEVLHDRSSLAADLGDRTVAMRHLLRVGTSAGGARAKALIAWNETTNEVRSGQVGAGEGFGCWLLKFDGVSGNRDKELEDPVGYGALEFAYHRMATAAGLEMAECRLLEEAGRRHFMTRRFDRTDAGRLHMLSLAGMAHYDFNAAGAHSYEQAMGVIRRLGMGMDALEQQFRRAAFNVVARNQDDHVKNIAFLMDREGTWTLAPAFDVTYSYNPAGAWTSTHQMRLNNKRDGFEASEFVALGRTVGLRRGRAKRILAEVVEVVAAWQDFADEVWIDRDWAEEVASNHRLLGT